MVLPDLIFETSWEVCNRVGGIYTVLSTKAKTLTEVVAKDQLIFIGPDVWKQTESPYFKQIKSRKFDAWCSALSNEHNIQIRIGRWNIPGQPLVFLVDYQSLFAKKDEIYGQFWEWFGVDSLHAYGDYDESAMFGYACGIVIKHYVEYQNLVDKRIIAHFNEWMTGFGLLYLKHYCPEIATVFTTHATSIGRSIAGNQKPLYDYLNDYNGDQMAYELNMESKHSIEKKSAHSADCFTTVSNITAQECSVLLEKTPDVVTPNGFENNFVPSPDYYPKKRAEARKNLKSIAEKVLGYELNKNILFIGTSGRYEFKNKGLDVFIDAIKNVSEQHPKQEIVAFLIIPANTSEYRIDKDAQKPIMGNNNPFSTHFLHNEENDPILNSIRWHKFDNKKENPLKIIFIPSYLEENDGIFNKTYYDILIGFDLTVFPSYYEPWGYTPLESIAFGIPTITTDLSGFGQWVSESADKQQTGVSVIHRTDSNYLKVVHEICYKILQFAALSPQKQHQMRESAFDTAQKALWKIFIKYYYEAYSVALSKKNK